MTMRVERKLAAYKAKAAKGYGGNVVSNRWQDHARGAQRVGGPDGTWQSLEHMAKFGSASDRAYYADNWPSWARNVTLAGEAYRKEHGYSSRQLDHTGWYCDSFQSNLCRGHVIQLVGKDRKPVFITGIDWTDQDGVTLWPLDTYDSAVDAAYAADSRAEREAEEGREHDAEFQAEQQIEELKSEIVDIRTDARALVRELKTARRAGQVYGAAVCAALRGKLASLREQSAEKHERIKKLTDNHWVAVAEY